MQAKFLYLIVAATFWNQLWAILPFFISILVYQNTFYIIKIKNGKVFNLCSSKLEHYWNTFNAVAAVDKATNACPVYTLCPHKKRPPFYFLNDSVKNQPILIVFGM